MKSPNKAQPIAEQEARAERGYDRSMRRFIIALCVLVGLFSPALYSLIRFSLESTLYSDILLVPVVSGFFVWTNRRQLPKPSAPDYRRGIPFAIVGAALLGFYWFEKQQVALAQEDALCLLALSFVSLLAATTALFLGSAMCRAVAFPLKLLVFIAPIPTFLTAHIEYFLQVGSAWVASLLFTLAGTPVLFNDLIFQLPGIRLKVAPECSGIHSTFVLLITSVVAAHVFIRSKWAKYLLVLSVIPLALLRNGFRIFTIGELCVRIGPEMIESYIHRHGGPIFFALSLIPFAAILLLLARADSRPSGPQLQPSI